MCHFKVQAWSALIVAGILAGAAAPISASAGSLNGMGGWQDGEYGNTLGAVTADALGLPGAHERLYSMTHDPAVVRDNGVPATFVAPVAPPAGYNSNYYYGSTGGGYYLSGGGRAVR